MDMYNITKCQNLKEVGQHQEETPEESKEGNYGNSRWSGPLSYMCHDPTRPDCPHPNPQGENQYYHPTKANYLNYGT